MKKCVVVWCDRAAESRGLCSRCYSRLHRGISPNLPPRPRATLQDKERLRIEISQRREAGEPIAGIAAGVGVNSETVKGWLAEWGVKSLTKSPARERDRKAGRPWTREDALFVIDRSDLPISERAAVIGRSVCAIVTFFYKYAAGADDPLDIKGRMGGRKPSEIFHHQLD